MAKKQAEQTREAWDATSLQAATPPDAEHPAIDEATLARYVELVCRDLLTPDEFVELANLTKALGKTAAQAELDRVIIREAQRRETLIAGEDEIRRADIDAQVANTAARATIEKEIIERAELLRTNGYPEATAYNTARQRVRELDGANGELSTLYARWPLLFGLPATTMRLTSEDMPSAVNAKMTELGIHIGGN